MKNISLQLKLTVLGVILLSAAAASAQQNRHVSNTYNFAFEIPKNSSKDPNSTEKELAYIEDTEPGGALSVTVDDEPKARQLSQALSSKIHRDAFVDGFIEGMKEEFNGAEITILERKELKIKGLSSFKIAAEILMSSGFRIRNATFFVPVPAQRRTYIFAIAASDSEFDRWYKVAEASVNSFKILKPKAK